MLIEYAGGMKLVAHHRGFQVVTDQTEKDGGDDTAMTPTELFIAALGTCSGVYALNFAKRHNIPVAGMKIEADYTYAERPRRVGSVRIRISLPQPVAEQLRVGLQRAAEQCLVHNSLRQPPEVSISVS
jgi:uncharacterized OsmC-like protein